MFVFCNVLSPLNSVYCWFLFLFIIHISWIPPFVIFTPRYIISILYWMHSPVSTSKLTFSATYRHILFMSKVKIHSSHLFISFLVIYLRKTVICKMKGVSNVIFQTNSYCCTFCNFQNFVNIRVYLKVRIIILVVNSCYCSVQTVC